MSNLNPNTRSEMWSPFISSEIERFLTAFQQIKIDVAPPDTAVPRIVLVHAPYMMQRVALVDQPKQFGYLKQRHQDRLRRVKAAREQAPEPVQQFLQRHFYDETGQERLLAAGRAERTEIQTLLQEAVRQRLVSVSDGQPYPDGRDLRRWLQTYGIGVDCSAFVQQALNHLLNVVQAAAGQAEASPGIRFLRSFRAYQEIKDGLAKRELQFAPVPTPAAAHPGDVLVKYGHIRIIAATEDKADGRRILHIAESTSALDIPAGQTEEEPDIGPRLLQVCYPEPKKTIGQQRPLRRRQHDTTFQANAEETSYVIGRYLPLAQLTTTSQPPRK